jgi:hypothetical protein
MPSSETVCPASPDVRNWRTGNVVARVTAEGGSARALSKTVPAKHESKTAKACFDSANRAKSPNRRSDIAFSRNGAVAPSGLGASDGTRYPSPFSVWP